MTCLAVIADIHGNRWALQAVLEDVARRGIKRIVNLGDSLDVDMDPAGVADPLIEHNVPSLAGDYETFSKGQLTAGQQQWLASLPKTRECRDIFCCHGTPTADNQALLEEITEGCVRLAPTNTILKRLGGVQHAVVLCAHKHVPRTVWLPTGQLVVNPGSVGLPAYCHNEPAMHVMEAGSPHARYAILTKHPAGWSVEHITLIYPWSKAAALARAKGREDRANWLETGRASSPSQALS